MELGTSLFLKCLCNQTDLSEASYVVLNNLTSPTLNFLICKMRTITLATILSCCEAYHLTPTRLVPSGKKKKERKKRNRNDKHGSRCRELVEIWNAIAIVENSMVVLKKVKVEL
jgi:hypothetical protein